MEDKSSNINDHRDKTIARIRDILGKIEVLDVPPSPDFPDTGDESEDRLRGWMRHHYREIKLELGWREIVILASEMARFHSPPEEDPKNVGFQEILAQSHREMRELLQRDDQPYVSIDDGFIEEYGEHFPELVQKNA